MDGLVPLDHDRRHNFEKEREKGRNTMKFGVSTYSFVRDLEAGKKSVVDVIHWVADHGGGACGDCSLWVYR